eukprot:UN10532
MLADMYGRVVTFTISMCLLLFSLIIGVLYTDNYYIWVCNFICRGLSYSLMSGTFEAYVWELLQNNSLNNNINVAESYKSAKSNLTFIKRLCGICAALLTSLLL